jgi:hypothetical protein
MGTFNIFDICTPRFAEEPHDRVLRWLCEPNLEHGVPDFAARIVRSLWGIDFDESVSGVFADYEGLPKPVDSKRRYPDAAIEFEVSLFIIENKVGQKTLDKGVEERQLEVQHEMGVKKYGKDRLYHALMCPDYMDVTGAMLPSPRFRVFRYSLFSKLIRESIGPSATADAAVLLDHYSKHIAEFVKRWSR